MVRSNPQSFSQESSSKRRRVTKVAKRPNGNNSVALRVPRNYAFPKLMQATLTYAETFIYPVPAGGVGSYNFSCNGLYDPNISGTGHQPMYFDQYMAIYDHYNVVSSTITWTFKNSSTSQYYDVALMIDDDSTHGVGTNWNTAAERPGAKQGTVGPISGAHGVLRMKQSWSRQTAFGKYGDNDPELKGSSSANPVESQQFIGFFKEVTATGSTDLFIDVVIKYNVVFDELASMTGS